MEKYPHLHDCLCQNESGNLKKTDPWYVDAPEYHNCFWTYLKYNERSHTLSEIASLLNLSISAITTIERKALDKLRKKIRMLQYEKKKQVMVDSE